MYKPFSAAPMVERGVPGLLYTTPIATRDIDCSVSGTAHLFQEWVPKDHEVRLTVVGDSCYAAAIHANSDAARIDWRADYEELSYRAIETPPAVRAATKKLMHRFGLAFAALDFVVTPSGEWVFLELNANGQWGWIEDETGLPISDAIAGVLAGGLRR